MELMPGQRIKDIEEGIDLADIEVIPKSGRARIVYLELVTNAKEETLFMFPTVSAFVRQYKIGAIPVAIDAAKKRNIKVRILVPYNEEVENRLVQGKDVHNHKIDIRYIEQMSDTKATILVVDRKESLVMELRDDSKTSFDEAIGLSTILIVKAEFYLMWRFLRICGNRQNCMKTSKEHMNN